MKRQKQLFTAATIVALLFVSACSATTTPTTSADSDAPTAPEATAPEPTSAPETTSAPDPTSTPATTAPPADGESESTTESSTIWAVVLLGVLLIGVVVWLASRSGAKRGAAQQSLEREAAAYEAEHRPTTDNGIDEPPSTVG